MKSSSPIRGLVIALSSVALLAPASAAAAGNGGAPAPSSVPAGKPFGLTASGTALVGRSLRLRGLDPYAAGKAIEVEAHQTDGGWTEVAAAVADQDGRYSAVWRPDSIGWFELRGVVGGAQAAAGAASSGATDVLVYQPGLATWYGPGFYGRRTACGRRLTRNLLGIANRRLRCGTKVRISYRGRSLVVPVVDRGPFAHHAQWDLTAATARRLGMQETSTIGTAPLALPLQPPAL